MVLSIKNKDGIVLDHFNIKCTISAKQQHNLSEIQEELVSAILRLPLLASQLPKAPPDCNWSLLVITNDEQSTSVDDHNAQRDALQSALSSGEWMLDNNHLTEQAVISSNV